MNKVLLFLFQLDKIFGIIEIVKKGRWGYLMDLVLDFLKNNYIYFIEAFLIFIIVFAIIKYSFQNKKLLSLMFGYFLIIAITLIAYFFKMNIVYPIYKYLLYAYPIFVIIVIAPDLRKRLDMVHKAEKIISLSSNVKTQNEIADACVYLSSKKIGALITIEKHNSLDQYAQKAIQIDSEVSKELLINIFTPYTPLHDGAVIIRGDRIRCAGAYYVLTTHEIDDKTTGSRHRAALGISEVSDSLTIICSEETGHISLAIEGMMIPIADKEKLLEYLEMFLR